MFRNRRLFGASLALLSGSAAALAQTPFPSAEEMTPRPVFAQATPQQLPPSAADTAPEPATGGTGIPAQSRPGEREEGTPATTMGPTPVENVRFLMDKVGLANLFGNSGIRTYGWAEGGYTYASGGGGLLPVEPRENRFGNEFLANQIGIVLERPLKQEDSLNFGFNVTYYAGADAALLQPKGGIDDPPDNPRFSHDFRQLYLSAHLPVLTEGGMDVKAGRMGTIIGYNGALAPYRPFYSSDYQWFYSEDGAWTGFLTNLHVNKQLDVLSGMTFGANTFFTKRSDDSYCYIGQINYWTSEEKKTLLTGSLHLGRDAIFAAPGLAGGFDTIVELRVLHNWSEYFTQIVQSNMGWDADNPVKNGQWYGLYTIGILHWNCKLDYLVRLEWFDDVHGTRTGIGTNYEAITLGTNWHPNKYIEFRPEIRADFAGEKAFGHDGVPANRSQLTSAMSALIKF